MKAADILEAKGLSATVADLRRSPSFGAEQLDQLQLAIIESDPSRQRTMGRNYLVPHAVYRFSIDADPWRADDTGFDMYDLALLVETLVRWPAIHHTSSKMGMKFRKMYVFRHNSRYGDHPIWELERACSPDAYSGPMEPIGHG